MAKISKTYRLDEDAISILEQLAAKDIRNTTNMLEILIFDAGKKAGIKPMKPEPPKKPKSPKA